MGDISLTRSAYRRADRTSRTSSRREPSWPPSLRGLVTTMISKSLPLVSRRADFARRFLLCLLGRLDALPILSPSFLDP
ncbi:hypothetical protein ACFFX0_32880 [Citricoccus parietis]|uniref:Uncharacterized protein n=1 Tax=Citricoccus parietis TaxID=592307 RepID=A0ABV5G8H9_9MICC